MFDIEAVKNPQQKTLKLFIRTLRDGFDLHL